MLVVKINRLIECHERAVKDEIWGIVKTKLLKKDCTTKAYAEHDGYKVFRTVTSLIII